MATLLAFIGMMVGIAGCGYQYNENRHVKKELKKTRKEFNKKKKAIDFSYKRADRRRSHEDQVRRSRDELRKNPKDEGKRQDYIRDIQRRYK